MYSLIAGIFFPLAILLLIVFWSIKNGIGPLPSTAKQTRAMLDWIPEDTHGPILELGSGWGWLAFCAARRFPNHQIIAYESSVVPFIISKLLFRSPNLTFRWMDFHNASVAEAGVILCYLYPGGMQALKPKLESELRKGALVISNTFAVPGWQPWKVQQIPDLYKNKIYIYKL